MAIASSATSVNLNFWRRDTLSFAAEKFKIRAPAAAAKRRLTLSTCLAENGRFEKKQSGSEEEIKRVRFKDYTEWSKDLMKSDGGLPRWFSPLECGPPHLDNSPLFLYLPGIDGIGLGLISHHQRLGKIFDIWCLHIPVMDRTPFKDMVQLVEMTVKSECSSSPDRPIYLVGESIGGCLALAVAARNPDIDLMLILANPATSFNMSRLQTLLYLLEIVPEQLHVGAPYILSLLTGDPLRMAKTSLEKGVSLQETVKELSEGFSALLPSSVLANILPRESILWKLQMLRSASSFVNFRLRSVKSEVLIFSSGRDLLLPSQAEAKRLQDILPNCRVRYFNGSGHMLLLEDGIDFVTIIKGVGFYRRTKNMDYVSDFMPPTSSELKQTSESHGWFDLVASPVMLSTLEDGNIVRGLAGIPCKGPVVFVSYHMLLGLDLSSLVYHFWAEKNILLRGLAHPMLFGKTFECQSEDPSSNDKLRLLGGVPISAANFYKLLSTNSHILLFPGGVREALHRKVLVCVE